MTDSDFFVGMKYLLDLRLLLTKMSIHLNLITVWSLIQSGNGWNFRNMQQMELVALMTNALIVFIGLNEAVCLNSSIIDFFPVEFPSDS